MPRVEVCLSPLLFPNFSVENKTVVVIDVFRATTTICGALANGVKAIIPVASREKAFEYQRKGFLIGGEHHGKPIEGFDLGNSPFHYSSNKTQGQECVLCTTNGTKAINMALEAKQIVAGSFVNLSSVAQFLSNAENDVLLFCAGWKNHYSLEDTLFAGALAKKLIAQGWEMDDDAGFSAIQLYENSINDLFKYLKQSSHYKRLISFGVERDIKYALGVDKLTVVPVFKDGKLVAN